MNSVDWTKSWMTSGLSLLFVFPIVCGSEGGREGGSEGGREGVREGGSEGGREGVSE